MNSKKGFQTKVWGAPAWLFLHCVAFNYTPEKRQQYMLFFRILADVLPCDTCQKNYKKLITTGKYRLQKSIFKSRFTFSKWLFTVHNQIQKDIYSRNSNDTPMYSNKDFKKIQNLYESFRAKCKKNQYGCTEPYEKGGKKRTIIRIHRFRLNICNQKHALRIM